MTKCPGTLSYMPPEALRQRPSYDAKLDCFSVGVMILHILCGRWPEPSEPTRVHPRKRNKVIGVKEVERREEYFRQVRVDHPLVELIRGCLENNPPLRPDAVRILGRLRQVISQSPPSCGNKMELLNQTQTLRNERQGLEQLQGEFVQLREVTNEVDELRAIVRTKDEEKRGLSEQLEQIQGECEQLREVSNEVGELRALARTKDEEKRSLLEQLEQSQRELTQSRGRQERLELTHSIDTEQVQFRVRELCTEVEGLRAVVRWKENVIQAKETEKKQAIQAKEEALIAKEMEKDQAIQAKETEKQQAIQAKEIEKQQAIQAKEIEKQQAIQAKEIEKQQAIQGKEHAIQEENLDLATKERVIESQQQEIASRDALLSERDSIIERTRDQVKTLQGYLLVSQPIIISFLPNKAILHSVHACDMLALIDHFSLTLSSTASFLNA